ncbi:PRC-barrel domain-containing protein [Roseicella aerolata]|uniref:PRC-barrel domain-containing protein n=1 Tax=Roseicella aerolata TaxID=2883479 RepID=A0A9X1IDY5_9PROT|nr:PRC-barrel domain-containing protein [Roseicella aerolata]MCB4821943.1 PRC-barrel domain-containing protein [Roseicella aerolata]
MMLRQFLLGAAAALSMAGIAAAQQAAAPGAAPDYREVKDEKLVVQPFNLTVDQIDDMDVHAGGGEKIGEIDEVLMNAAGQPVAVTVEAGGFLGIGAREVILTLDQLRLDGQRFVTSLTRAQVEALPQWND